MTGVITAAELRRISDELEMAKAREALEKKRKAEEERDGLRDAFMTREVRADALDRVNRAIRAAAERGEHELLAFTFPSDYTTDGGRAINNFEPGWPETLTGFAKKAHEFWQKELEPNGFKLRAQIVSYPGGKPGDVGMFLSW